MPWQTAADPVPLCGMCSSTMSIHHITRHPVGWVAICAPGQMSDIQDQTLLELIASGQPS